MPKGTPVPGERIRAQGWLLDRQLTLAAVFFANGCRIEIPEIADFQVFKDINQIISSGVPDEADLFIESLLGPPLIVSLAFRDVWCLHASAVAHNGKCAVFLGDSGAGKSTLAAFMAEQAGCSLVSDDILPVKMTDGKLVGFNDFPQLKLTQPIIAQIDSRVPVQIQAVYILKKGADVRIKGLAGRFPQPPWCMERLLQ